MSTISAATMRFDSRGPEDCRKGRWLGIRRLCSRTFFNVIIPIRTSADRQNDCNVSTRNDIITKTARRCRYEKFSYF